MKTSLALLATGLLVSVLYACSSNTNQDSVSAAREANATEDTTTTFRTVPDLGVDTEDPYSDADFAVKAAEGGLFEVQLGEIAAGRALNQDVKEFANSMVTDHGMANQELASLARQKNIVLPTALSRDNQEDLREFNEMPAADFDEEYIERMIDDHERTIKLFERASSQSPDSGIKAFATKQLPILKKHLEHARSIDDKR